MIDLIQSVLLGVIVVAGSLAWYSLFKRATDSHDDSNDSNDDRPAG